MPKSRRFDRNESSTMTDKLTPSALVLCVLCMLRLCLLRSRRERDVLPLFRMNRSPLMLSHDNSEQRVERVRVRLEGSTWSVPFGLDQVGIARFWRESADDARITHLGLHTPFLVTLLYFLVLWGVFAVAKGSAIVDVIGSELRNVSSFYARGV